MLDLRVDDEWTIAQHGSLMARHIVWYTPDSVAASLLDDLPEDLEPRALGELAPAGFSETTGVLLVDLAGSDAAEFQTEFDRIIGKTLVMLLTRKPFFLCRRNDLAIADETRRRVVIKR